MRILAALLAGLMTLNTAVTAVAAEVPERADIDAKYKWDLTDMYASADAWEKDAKAFQAELPGLARYKGTLAESGKALLSAIQAQETVQLRLWNLYVYAGLKSFEDQRNGDNAARFSRARGLLAGYQEAVAYFSPELLAISPDTLESMIASTPGLEPYRHYLDEESRLRDFTLSEAEEKLLAMGSDARNSFSSVFGAMDNADLSFGTMTDESGNEVELTKSRYAAFLSSTQREVREAAWTGLFQEYEQLGNTLAANYEGHVKGRVFTARARGFGSALHAATYGSAIPRSVYTNLITAVKSGAPTLQKYLELRRQALDVEELEIWDLYAPIVKPYYDEISWEDGKKLVAEALAPLGEDYIELYWRGFDEGWVDAFESRGKRGGAYSWGSYTSKPYLSMNYEGKLGDVSTLAHEYGHSLHSYMTRNSQPFTYGSYRTFIAEVASMTNEAILFQKMLADAQTPQEKAYLLQTYLDEFRGGFFRQTSFADFEMQAHAQVEAGEALTKDSLNTLYADVFNDYYGDAVNAHPLNASEWSRIPHFLRNDNFYVYQYATSFAAATALARGILEEGEPARERFLAMLRSGNNDYPIELLKKAGVDMTTPEPIYATLRTFEALVAELEATLDELDAE